MGAFHRRLEVLATLAIGEARATVEDDFHHFRVTVRAQDGVVREVLSETLRNPNTLCPAAGLRLSELHSMRLSADSTGAQFHTDPSEQCTHQLDLAGLAIASLARGRARCLYEAVIPDRVDGRTTAMLHRDGQRVLGWDIDGMTIAAPYPGRSLGAGFTKFTRGLAPDDAEAALVLRRALFVSQARSVTFDLDDREELMRRGPVGGCWAWQPARMGKLVVLPHNRRDFTGQVEQLGALDRSWLRHST